MAEKLRVLITGATSGLGREAAVQLAHRGARVAITGRREDRLREVSKAVEAAGGESLALLGSVTEMQDVRRHYGEIRKRWGGLDWAILNSGVSEPSNAREFRAEIYRQIFETNIFGVANWLEAVLPDMLAAGRGTIAGVASLAGFRGFPGHGAYCASKAALITMLESIRIDLRGTGVSVVTVCPGFIRSEMTARNDPKQMPFLMEVEDGVRCMLRGIEQKKRAVHFPWQLSYPIRYVVANLPNGLYEWFASKRGPVRKRQAIGA